MGMIVCKPCFDQKIQEWKTPFNQNVGDLERTPEYNEYVQHYSVYEIEDVASKLQSGEMIEIMCTICKKTHVAKDENGVVKVKYTGGNWQNW
jgi:hypothetical protein